MSQRLSFLPARVQPRLLPLVIALAAAGTACRDDSGSSLAADSALARDIALANVVATQPEFNDAPLNDEPQPEPPKPATLPVRSTPPVAETPRPATRPAPRPAPAPRRERPAPVPEAPDPVPEREAAPEPARTPAAAPGFAAGTRLALTTSGSVCTVSGRPGDKIAATLRDPVRGSGGAVIPAGATIVLEVVSVEPGDPVESGSVVFRVRSLDIDGRAHPARGSGAVRGDLQRAQVRRVNASDRRKVATGAIAGAILGRVLGGDTRGAVIGAAAGGAAGAVKASRDKQFEGCLPSGSPVSIVLDDALTLASGYN